ncbi:MAG: fibrobacter succinogenes major paralogous domain-containing protein [Bacteroidales bacterium]|nr:fibrobacter succinogenes major paralogous domain-containing protein [Bacteroidales bacterium]
MNLSKSSFLIPGAFFLLLAIYSCSKDEAPPVFPVSDIDGNGYDTITFGSQTWLLQNLRTTKYANGDTIGTTYPHNKDISGEIAPKYQWPPYGVEQNATTKGRLYTWYTVTDSRGLCPTGWHVPSHAEWTTLVNYLISKNYGYGGSGGDIAKAMASESEWKISNTPGTPGNDMTTNNSSGFTALPIGVRKTTSYLGSGDKVSFWSATEYNAGSSRSFEIWYNDSDILSNILNEKHCGASVRCIKD